ncbi:NTP transferase domain-containing protein [Actinomycetes bacterium KLBMP 9797]
MAAYRDAVEAKDTAAIILAGGAGRRMGGVDKPAVRVGARSMLDSVLDACRHTAPRVVVGPVRDVPPGVLVATEEPPGGGPVAAIAAGLAKLDPLLQPSRVAVLAADLPLLEQGAVGTLEIPLLLPDPDGAMVDGVVFVDDSGRRQLLCGLWLLVPLRAALDDLARERADGLTGASMRALVDKLSVAEMKWGNPGPPPWYDCDTDEDLRQARKWMRRRNRRER